MCATRWRRYWCEPLPASLSTPGRLTAFRMVWTELAGFGIANYLIWCKEAVSHQGRPWHTSSSGCKQTEPGSWLISEQRLRRTRTSIWPQAWYTLLTLWITWVMQMKYEIRQWLTVWGDTFSRLKRLWEELVLVASQSNFYTSQFAYCEELVVVVVVWEIVVWEIGSELIELPLVAMQARIRALSDISLATMWQVPMN